MKVTLDDAMARLGDRAWPRFEVMLRHGSLLAEVYAPRGRDPQQPHTRDEIYVVMRGRGWFVDGGERYPVAPGDLLFVPAHRVHRFEDFDDDFCTWVLFYGPEGGESADPALPTT